MLPLIADARRYKPPSPEEIIEESGISSWNEQPDSETEAKAFTYIAEQMKGASDTSRVSLRERLIRRLKELRYRSSARMVDTFLGTGPNTPSELHATLQQSPEEARQASWNQCESLAREPDILKRVVETMRLFHIAGEDRLIKLTYLALTSRLLDRPVSQFVKGPSAVGKSYPIETLLRLFPPTAYYALTAMSEHGLIYLAEPMAHKMLILYEATGFDSDMQSYLIRSLLSERVYLASTNYPPWWVL